MEQISAFISAIPAAAASPLALVAYLATLVAWTLVAWRVNRFTVLMNSIDKLPEKDRIEAIRVETGRVVPKGMTAEQYLRSRIHSFILVGFFVLCATVAFVASMALIRVYEQRARADGYIIEILGEANSAAVEAQSAYKSATMVLKNGATMVREAQGEIKPSLTKEQLDQFVDQLAQKHVDRDEINNRLRVASGTDRLKRANEKLAEVASRINSTYKKLADCFRGAECRRGNQFERMCAAVKDILANAERINAAARAIPGVNFNASGTVAMLGGGSMDIDFKAIELPEVAYLGTVVCTG